MCESEFICAVPARGQKRTLGPLELKLQVVVSHLTQYWESNSGPLKEQYSLLTTEPSPVPRIEILPSVSLYVNPDFSLRVLFVCLLLFAF